MDAAVQRILAIVGDAPDDEDGHHDRDEEVSHRAGKATQSVAMH